MYNGQAKISDLEYTLEYLSQGSLNSAPPTVCSRLLLQLVSRYLIMHSQGHSCIYGFGISTRPLCFPASATHPQATALTCTFHTFPPRRNRCAIQVQLPS